MPRRMICPECSADMGDAETCPECGYTATPGDGKAWLPVGAKVRPKKLLPQYRTLRIERDATRAEQSEDGQIPVAFSSEEPYARWWGTEILSHEKDAVDLSYAKEGLPFLADHDPSRQIGLLQSVTIDKDGVGRGMLSFGAHPDAAWIEKDIRSGVRKNVSVGYQIDQLKLLESDEKTGVDTYLATKWTPMEASTVAVPADITVGIGRAARRDAHPLTLILPTPTPPIGGGPDMPETEKAGAPTAEAILAVERQRVTDITALAKENGISTDEVMPLIEKGVTADVAGREMLKIMRTRGAGQPTPIVTGVQDRAEDKPWKSWEEQLAAIVRAGLPNGKVDPRLLRAATGANETIGSDGGFLVAPQFVAEILKTAFMGGQILSRVRKIPIGPNSKGLYMNAIDETSRVDGSRMGGVLGYWLGEGDTKTPTRPKFRRMELDLKKLAVLLYATDELLEDSTAFSAIANEGFADEITFQTENAIINGTGGAKPLGILPSGALVTQAAVGGQTADTVNATNVVTMYSRMHPSSIPNAVWLVDSTVLPQLSLMTVGQEAVYLPPGGLNPAPWGILLGRPVIPTEYQPKLGDVGDIILADLNQYLLIDKGGVQTAQSIHVRFINDETVLRAVYRVDGQPMWYAPLTPYNGNAAGTQSPFVTLAAR